MQARPTLYVDIMGRLCRFLDLPMQDGFARKGVHAIVLSGQIDVERPPIVHVHGLHAPADTKRRHIESMREIENELLDGITQRRDLTQLLVIIGIWRDSVALRVDVLTAREHEAIDDG